MNDTELVDKIEEKIELKVPSMYKVVLHNDDFTTFEFVVAVLMNIFHRSGDEALRITDSIHHTGKGVAGSPYTREIAEEKVAETIGFAQANEFPLKATFEVV